MRKYLLSMSLLLSGLSSFALYNSMEFKMTDGSTTVVESKDLTINVEGNNLIVANSKGEAFTFDASELQSMQFTDDDGSGGVNTLFTNNDPVEVFTIDGMRAGKYSSLNHARQSLPNGMYILKGSKGNTIKIIVSR